MRKEETITIGGKDVTVRELTATQVDSLMRLPSRAPLAVELLIDTPILAEAVCMATGLTEEAINGPLAPSEACELWAAVARVNDFLSRMVERLGVAAGKLLDPSGQQPAPSSGTGT